MQEKELVDDDNESYNDKCDNESDREYFPDQDDFSDVTKIDEVEVEADVANDDIQNV